MCRTINRRHGSAAVSCLYVICPMVWVNAIEIFEMTGRSRLAELALERSGMILRHGSRFLPPLR